MAKCANCGARLARIARFCPQCGLPTEGPSTRVMEVPPEETGQVPVTIRRVERRLYGVTPATLVLVLAGAALALDIVLFAVGHWPVGLILLGATVLLLLVFLGAARRTPKGTVSRTTVDALDSFRARAGVAAESLATRGRAARRTFDLQRELKRIASQRGRLLFELGDAVYREDEQGAEDARSRIVELDGLREQREAEVQEVFVATQDRLARGRMEVQPTEIVEPPPEPDPGPGEGNPAGPARIPEPGPKGRKKKGKG